MLSRRNLIVGAGIGTVCLATRSLAASGDHGASFVDRLAQEQISSGQCAGLAVGLKHKGQVILSKGYGLADVASKTLVTDRSVFRIASITKTFTAISIIQLKNAGKLKLDDRLSLYFPSFPRGHDVTLAQLLSHTAGIYDFVRGFPPGSSPHWTTADEFIDRLLKVETLYDFDPGTHYSYSNSGYVLLGAIIEQVSGQPLERYMAGHIFTPLGLTDTVIDHTGDKVDNRAIGYNLVGGQLSPAADDGMLPFSAGAIRSSLRDMMVWQTALWNGTLLPKADLATMARPARLNDGQLADTSIWWPSGGPPGKPPAFITAHGYGFGLESTTAYGHLSIGHNGGISGYNSIVARFPQDDVEVVMLANTDNGIVSPWFKLLEGVGNGKVG
ncbi:serine hydrolase domain-containing protein [Asticcacaulis sp. 201]|uniref:serine hydrolase domain-containing protein n=1 Tax=Asticcacaulis sp. 201 TaxID=3028787 RepID=UPI00291689B2|nr:serine hydrolase domain-containing protein [Asticcacaulis sp. 201]MDV6330970.1 serine hydrolase domain-containing protein [Asticcacaulis sp. 201]